MPDRPEIRLQRVYDVDTPSIGKRILVDRVWPRGLRKEALHLDAWLREIGPTDELRRWFGHDPARWDEFQRRYRAELDQPAQQVNVHQLAEQAQEGPITLLYGARDEQHNQAVVLRTVLEECLDYRPSPAQKLSQDCCLGAPGAPKQQS
ncbi:MAG TPA: DUF488 domain-containing protein [Chloroflexota bacterium]|nr:DUF488 domain-containing protein [Chloroflexota bacterium]